MPLKDPVRVLDHPKGPGRFVSASRALGWVQKGKAVYIDQERSLIRLFIYPEAAPLNAKRSGMGMRRISRDWNGESLPDDSHCAIRHARIEAERRHRLRNAIGSHTAAEWQGIVTKSGDRCLRCGIRAVDTFYGRLTKDHIVPLESGGTDYASNLQPLCVRCNSWKGNREIDFRRCPAYID